MNRGNLITSKDGFLVPAHRAKHGDRLAHSRRRGGLALAATHRLRTDLLVFLLLALIRDRELKHRPIVDSGRNPQPTIMRLDDRTADGQPHPDPARLRREERVEYA